MPKYHLRYRVIKRCPFLPELRVGSVGVLLKKGADLIQLEIKGTKYWLFREEVEQI